MTQSIVFPKIETVTPLPNQKLLVRFVGGEERLYDCRPLLDQEPFYNLRNDFYFRQVQVDVGGYGVSWSDAIDLSESEIWVNGERPKPSQTRP